MYQSKEICLETKKLTKAKHVVKNVFPTLDIHFPVARGLQDKGNFTGDKMSTY